MKSSRFSLLLLFSLALLLDGCDTASNVEDPTKNYYLKYIGKKGRQTGVDFEIAADGTLILLGTTQLENAPSQLWVVKADADGNVIWDVELGGPLDEEARDVEITSDGRIVVLGNSYQSGVPGNGSRDIFIATLRDADGGVIDSVTFGYVKVGVVGTPADDNATTVTQTTDGFVIAGSSDNISHQLDTTSAIYKRDALITRLYDDLTKYDPSWTDPPAFSQASESITTKIIQVGTGTFYAFGYAKYKSDGGGAAQNNFNFWYFPIGLTGVGTGSVMTFGSTNLDEKLKSVVPVPLSEGDGFVLGGTVTKQDGTYDIYMGRLRNPLTFSDTDPQFGPVTLGFNLGRLSNELVSVCVAKSSGFYLLTNDASASNGNNNFKLVKISAAGNTDWSSAIYGGSGDDFIGAVRELPDGKIVVFGTMSIGQGEGEPKMVLIKVNKDGQFAK